MTGPYGESRWDRLAASVNDAGFDANICARPRIELLRGRLRHRTDHSITVRHHDGGLTTITDVYRRGVWVGWEARREGADGATARLWPATKKRGVVVQNLASDQPTGESRRPPLEEAS